jgi:dephospho-CoA kinase
MFTLGLTGGIATGKTTATDFFKTKGIDIIDADEVSRFLQQKGQKGYHEIIQQFGTEVLDEHEEINRKKLRDIAFSNQSNKEKLEDIMHPMIRNEIADMFGRVKSKWAIYSAPIWTGKTQFSRTLVIDAPRASQVERICQRDQNNEELANKIIDGQMSYKARISYADDFIMNDSSLEDFKTKLEFYFSIYEQQS